MSFANPQLDYFVRSFHLGYMDTPQPDTLPPGGTPDARNCLFASEQFSGRAYPGGSTQPRATLQKRTGARLLTPAAVVAGAGFDGLYEFRKVGQTSGRIVAVIAGRLYYWDGAAFIRIGAKTPFTPGNRAQFFVQRNLLFITDGTATAVWDGVLGNDYFDAGHIAPAVAPGLTDGGAVGSTLSAGTWEGFAVWYDSVHDHETSPGPTSAPLVLVAGHQRTWTLPAGAPGSIYDKWRVYCRRVDTNEVYFKRVVDATLGTSPVNESLTDAARNLQTLGPLPGVNDPPPATLLAQMEFQGYRLGFKVADDQLYVSKLEDPQSQLSTDILGIGRGKGGELRSCTVFSTQAVLQKAGHTYRLDGDRMPFVPKDVNANYGNVGPKSAIEANGRLYAWDEEKGPYWTDLGSGWVPIATARVQGIVQAVPKTIAKDIECVYCKSVCGGLVLWAIPQGASSRRRMLLGYAVELDAWLPPITGLEYESICTQIDALGNAQLYVGDYWGRFFQYFTDHVEGVPSGTLIARVSAAGTGDVTCDNEVTLNANGTQTIGAACAFDTTDDGLMGLPVLHLDANKTAQWRRIASMTAANHLALDVTNDSPWGNVPVAGDLIIVGGIDWYWTSPVIDFGDPFKKKLGRWFGFQAVPGSGTFLLGWQVLLGGLKTRAYLKTFALAASAAWGAGVWGTMIWGAGDPETQKRRINRSFFGFAFRLSNPFPNQPVELLGIRVTADPIGYKLARSGGDS